MDLRKHTPNFVFCTNQRPLSGIAPILAARDLSIPTGTFIFSWDNLPKGMLVVESDYYFVWSDYMKMELMKYYSFIKEEEKTKFLSLYLYKYNSYKYIITWLIRIFTPARVIIEDR